MVEFEAKGKTYLGEFMDDLPDNMIINKVTTGCGMTSLALSNNKKYVVCVPFKSLIDSKLKWCKNHNIEALGVYSVVKGGASKSDILEFKGNKILVTWDSLYRVVEALGDSISEWKILVDESHKLIDSGAFRYEAIDYVLDNYKKFGSFVFGTATPVKDRYQHPKLKGIPKALIKWDNLQAVSIHYTRYDKDLNKAAAVLAINFLKGIEKGNAHIFINSVQSIIDILKNIKKGKGDLSKIRIVCSPTDKNKALISNRLGKVEISSITDEVKKVNFYTSTCFEGCDIMDKEGRTYVIADGTKDCTKIDILTTLPQIIGRIRDSVVKNCIQLWYSPSPYYSYTTEEEFEEAVKKNIESAGEMVKDFQSVSEKSKKALIQAAELDPYMRVVVDKEGITHLKVNDTIYYNELHSFESIHCTYYVTKKDREEGDKPFKMDVNHIPHSYLVSNPITIKGLDKVKLGKVANFKDLVEKYHYNKSNGLGLSIETQEIEKANPLIKEAYDKIGYDKMKALKFVQKDIRKELTIKDSTKNNRYKITELLGYRIGEFVIASEVKEKLKSIYKDLGIDKVAKSTDIKDYYDIRTTAIRINGKLVKGAYILSLASG